MTPPAGRRTTAAALVPVLTVVAAALYLRPFVARGWIPQDEGTLMLDAMRLMAGEVPHVAFQDPYTGGLTWAYAALFHFTGADIIHTRWLLYAGTLVATTALYRIARRFAEPAAASGVALTAIVWAFPNYFSGMPSWWCLILLLVLLDVTLCYFERGRVWLVWVAGVLAGLAFLVKQPGIYFLAALLFALAAGEQASRPFADGPQRRPWRDSWPSMTLASATAGATALVAAPAITLSSAVVLVGPVLALCLFLVADERRRAAPRTGDVRRLCGRMALAVAGFAAPVALFLVPYARHGALAQWAHGVFVLPQERYGAGVLPLPPLALSVALVALAPPLVMHLLRRGSRVRVWWTRAAWVAGLALLVTQQTFVGYQLLWNAARTGAALLVPAALLWLWRARPAARRASELFVLAAGLAWIGFFQFPFSVPIYFCYAAPVAVVLLWALLESSGAGRAPARAAIVGGLLLFAVLSMNTGHATNLGLIPMRQAMDAPLGLPHASITVDPSQAADYQWMAALVARHRPPGGGVHAFPDCPEVYVVTDSANPLPSNYDFFLGLSPAEVVEVWESKRIAVLVINSEQVVSPRPSAALLAEARARFRNGERSGRFEVRWR